MKTAYYKSSMLSSTNLLLLERFRWTHYYPMRPRERSCKWQRSDASGISRSHVTDNLNAVHPDYIDTAHILTIYRILFKWSQSKYLFKRRNYSTHQLFRTQPWVYKMFGSVAETKLFSHDVSLQANLGS